MKQLKNSLSKKKDKIEDLSLNHQFRIGYRKRKQEELEQEQELREWLDNVYQPGVPRRIL